jgi:hypothetical protein
MVFLHIISFLNITLDLILFLSIQIHQLLLFLVQKLNLFLLLFALFLQILNLSFSFLFFQISPIFQFYNFILQGSNFPLQFLPRNFNLLVFFHQSLNFHFQYKFILDEFIQFIRFLLLQILNQRFMVQFIFG